MKNFILTLLITFTFININAQTDTIPKKNLFDYSLEELLNLKIKVSTKTESTIDESPSIATVITREMIEATNAQTLSDLIRSIPGFDFSRVSIGWGEPLDEFYTRGILNDFSQTTLFLLNGRNKFNDLTYASMWMSHKINVDMIERIEVIRGPGSALYGGNAFSSVINIITRDTDLKQGSIIEARAGSYNAYSLYALSKIKLTKSGWMLGMQGKYFSEKGTSYDEVKYDHIYNPGAPIPEADKITDGINPSFDISINITAPKKKLRAQFWHTDHNPHPFLTGFYPVPNLDKYGYRVTQSMFNLEYTPIENLKISTYYSRMFWNWKSIVADSSMRVRKVQYQKDDFIGTDQNNDDLNFDAQYLLKFGNKNNILFGASYNRESQFDPVTRLYDTTTNSIVEYTEGEHIAYNEFTRNIFAGYSQLNFYFNKITFTGGLRYDYYSDINDKFIINPRAAIVWNTRKNIKFKFLYGKAFRPPSGYEVQGGNTLVLAGNPDLKPEKIRTGELAYIQYFNFVRLQISTFMSKTNNTIFTYDDGNPTTLNQYENIGKINAMGGEIELQGKIWWINYSYVNSKLTQKIANKKTTGDITFLTSHHVNAGIAYTFRNKLFISSQVFFRGPRLTPYGTKTKAYFEQDIKIGYSYKFLKLEIGGRNITNHKNTFPMNDGGYYMYPYRGRELFAKLIIKIKHNK